MNNPHFHNEESRSDVDNNSQNIISESIEENYIDLPSDSEPITEVSNTVSSDNNRPSRRTALASRAQTRSLASKGLL